MRYILGLALLLAPVTASAVVIQNASFETPAISGFAYQPSDPGGWTYISSAGIEASDSQVLHSNPAPNGNQIAFIQSDSAGTGQILQLIGGLSTGMSYTVSFYVATRPGGFAADPIDVTFGGTDLGTVTPSSTTFVLTSAPGVFTATGSSALLLLTGANSLSEMDTALDLVSISEVATPSQVPEPGSLALVAFGLVGAVFVRRKFI